MILVHIEAVDPDAAGALMDDLLGLRRLRYVVDLEPAVVIAAPRLLLDLQDGLFGHAHLLRQLGAGRRTPERLGKLGPHAWQFVGAAPYGGRIGLMIDDHDVARDPRFVAVRGRVASVMAATVRDRGIGHVQDGGAEIGGVGNVAHIGKAPRDRHLPGAGKVEMADAAHIAGERAAAIICIHLVILSSARKP